MGRSKTSKIRWTCKYLKLLSKLNKMLNSIIIDRLFHIQEIISKSLIHLENFYHHHHLKVRNSVALINISLELSEPMFWKTLITR